MNKFRNYFFDTVFTIGVVALAFGLNLLIQYIFCIQTLIPMGSACQLCVFLSLFPIRSFFSGTAFVSPDHACDFFFYLYDYEKTESERKNQS